MSLHVGVADVDNDRYTDNNIGQIPLGNYRKVQNLLVAKQASV
jgi:hypothetical protein